MLGGARVLHPEGQTQNEASEAAFRISRWADAITGAFANVPSEMLTGWPQSGDRTADKEAVRHRMERRGSLWVS